MQKTTDCEENRHEEDECKEEYKGKKHVLTKSILDIVADRLDGSAEMLVFEDIPAFQRLRKERMQAEAEFRQKNQERFEEAKKLLDRLSAVATSVYGKKFPVEEICTENPKTSFDNLWSSVMSACLQNLKKPFFKRRRVAKKFCEEMSAQFGIKTEVKKDLYEICRSLMATLSSRYLRIFEGVGDEYYKKVTKAKEAETAAERLVKLMLQQIHVEKLLPKWEAGREDDVIGSCVRIMVEYEAHLQKVPRDQIRELKGHFRYLDREKKEWVPCNYGTIKIFKYSPLMVEHESFEFVPA